MRGVVLGVLIAILIVAGQPVSATVTPPPAQIACDFVTGGGYIVGGATIEPQPPLTLADGAKGNFGVGGGVRNGVFWGHLEYNDHSASSPLQQVHGTSVTGYFVGGSDNSRIITGIAEVNGIDGFAYSVEVTDNAEPGRGADVFSIHVEWTTPYTAGGILGGGNIQLHEPNASNAPPPNMTCSPTGIHAESRADKRREFGWRPRP
jgi:hypothetical protein